MEIWIKGTEFAVDQKRYQIPAGNGGKWVRIEIQPDVRKSRVYINGSLATGREFEGGAK